MADMLNTGHEHALSDRRAARAPVARYARSATSHINLMPAVRSQIIPRLHAALQESLQKPRHPLVAGGNHLSNEISAFADRSLASDDQGIRDRVDALRVEGRSLESIYLDVLAPTACHLRDLWSDDLCGLADVTLALCTLQAVLRHYASDFYAEASSKDTGLRALLVSPSQKQADVGLPTFGLLLMSEFFRREGWDAWAERDLSSESFRGAVLGEWFDLVEVLATSDKQLDEISSGIRALRRGSPNPSIGVIVCGQVFIDHPEFVRLVGADLMAADPLSSLSQAKDYITRTTQRKRLS